MKTSSKKPSVRGHQGSIVLCLLLLLLLLPFSIFGQVANDLPIVTEEAKAFQNQSKTPSSDLKISSLSVKTTSAKLLNDAPNVNASNRLGNEAEVSISVNPTNRDNQVICGHAPNFNDMNTFFTTDGGRTWTFVPLGDPEDGNTSNFRFDPTVAFAEDGNVYVSYGLDDEDGNRYLVVARSSNGGQSYDQFTTVAIDNTLDKWIIGTGPDANSAGQFNVYLAYRITESDRVVTRLASSYDQGASFSTDVLISDSGDVNTFGMPAVGPNGEVYVVWDDMSNRPTSSSIRVDVSLDNGNTFGTDRLVGTTGVTRGNTNRYDIPAQPDRGILAVPSIAVDRSGGPNNGRVYVAYTIVGSGGFNDTDIVVRYSDDQGQTWSAENLVNSDGGTNSQFLPWLDVDQVTGQVVVVWYDARNDINNQQVEAFIGYSNNGGNSFTNLLVSDNPSDQSANNPNASGNNFLEYIGVSSRNGVAFPVWADNSEDPADLDFFTDQIPIGEAPLADAGDNQSRECTGAAGAAFTLDGSGSSDPNGDALTYTWYREGLIIAGPTPDPTVELYLPLGAHIIILEVNDGNLLTATDEVTVTVEDTTPPVITLNGLQEITIECGIEEYTEAGAMVTDICDADVPVVISGTVDVTTPGTYIITYDAVDASGNNAVSLERSITIEDTTPPVISLNGDSEINLECGIDEYTEAGATVTDECDQSISVVISGTVDTTTPGIYIISYTATDASGNNAEPVERTINVEDTTPPDIKISSPPITLWPPNHSYHSLSLTDLDILVEDECDKDVSREDVVIVSVVSDELEDARGGGDGFTTEDIVIGTSCQSLQLRAERQGGGNGRIYTINLQVADASGNVGMVSYEVHVPADIEQNPFAIGDAPLYTVTAEHCDPAVSSFLFANSVSNKEKNVIESTNGYALEANYPNPFSWETRINFTLPEGEDITLKVFNMQGQEVALLLSGYQKAGTHELVFDASDLHSGIYLYRLESKSFSMARRMILIK